MALSEVNASTGLLEKGQRDVSSKEPSLPALINEEKQGIFGSHQPETASSRLSFQRPTLNKGVFWVVFALAMLSTVLNELVGYSLFAMEIAAQGLMYMLTLKVPPPEPEFIDVWHSFEGTVTTTFGYSPYVYIPALLGGFSDAFASIFQVLGLAHRNIAAWMQGDKAQENRGRKLAVLGSALATMFTVGGLLDTDPYGGLKDDTGSILVAAYFVTTSLVYYFLFFQRSISHAIDALSDAKVIAALREAVQAAGPIAMCYTVLLALFGGSLRAITFAGAFLLVAKGKNGTIAPGVAFYASTVAVSTFIITELFVFKSLSDGLGKYGKTLTAEKKAKTKGFNTFMAGGVLALSSITFSGLPTYVLLQLARACGNDLITASTWGEFGNRFAYSDGKVDPAKITLNVLLTTLPTLIALIVNVAKNWDWFLAMRDINNHPGAELINFFSTFSRLVGTPLFLDSLVKGLSAYPVPGGLAKALTFWADTPIGQLLVSAFYMWVWLHSQVDGRREELEQGLPALPRWGGNIYRLLDDAKEGLAADKIEAFLKPLQAAIQAKQTVVEAEAEAARAAEGGEAQAAVDALKSVRTSCIEALQALDDKIKESAAEKLADDLMAMSSSKIEVVSTSEIGASTPQIAIEEESKPAKLASVITKASLLLGAYGQAAKKGKAVAQKANMDATLQAANDAANDAVNAMYEMTPSGTLGV
jgi:hypothetical protein